MGNTVAVGNDQRGAVVSLGPLESRVMDIAWRRGAVTVREVADELEPVTDSAYTTIMTVMSRLVEKGLLKRSTRARAYVYRATMSKQLYDEALSRMRVRNLITEFGETAIAQFAEELEEVDPERARRLGEMLRRAKKR